MDSIRVTAGTNQWITYTYDATGTLLRKKQYKTSSTVPVMVTDYIDGFVFENDTLKYFAAAEGRVRVNSGTLINEYVITDIQGNSRISFEDNGNGIAVVRQENSYYPFGLIMSNGITPSTQPNKNLYNAGSEWQNDYVDLPDYYQTFFRNYDAAVGRWTGVDIAADEADSWTPYQYAYNNPGMLNDPMGDLTNATGPYAEFWNTITQQEGAYTNKGNGKWGRDDGSEYEFTDLPDPNKFGRGYTVDENGLVSSTPIVNEVSQLDVLYAKKNGKIDDKNKIFVSYGILSNFPNANSSTGSYNFLTVQNSTDARSLFEYLARNTDVEWALVRTTLTSYIATDHAHGSVNGGNAKIYDIMMYNASHRASIETVLEQSHSHPQWASQHISFGLVGPSGFNQYDAFTKTGEGDRGVAGYYEKYYSTDMIHSVYQVSNNTYYYYNSFQILKTVKP